MKAEGLKSFQKNKQGALILDPGVLCVRNSLSWGGVAPGKG